MNIVTSILILILTLMPWNCFAQSFYWNEYVTIKNNYFFLDKQDFNSITCNIEVSMITKMFEQIRTQLEPLKNNIQLSTDLNNFTLTYASKGIISYTDPKLNVTLKSSKGIADVDKVNKGIKEMSLGFEKQIASVKQQINGLFDDYLSPKRKEYTDMIITKNKDSISVKYKKSKSTFTEKYTGNIITANEQSPTTNSSTKQFYIQATNKKLILERAVANIKFPTMDISMDVSVKYKDIGSITFPNIINVKFEQNLQSIKQSGGWEIGLNKCSIVQ